MRKELETNRGHWDEATRFHVRGNSYGAEDFRAGKCLLRRIETEEVGDVRGKRLLHLQCHFGLDTLCWARRGAVVTGVDFSPLGIAEAERLSAETGIPGSFLCSDLYALRQALHTPAAFDIVFTSYGVLCWLPDLTAWAETIVHFLAPGGVFYIVEAHPTARMFPMDEDMPKAGTFRPLFPYFHEPAGIAWPPSVDYADDVTAHTTGEHIWWHSLGDIINALIGAGLVLEYLHEFPFCTWKVVADCELVERLGDPYRYYARPASEPQLPLLFSLRASKPAG